MLTLFLCSQVSCVSGEKASIFICFLVYMFFFPPHGHICPFDFQQVDCDMSRYTFLCVEFAEPRESVLMSFINIGYFLAILSSNISFVLYSLISPLLLWLQLHVYLMIWYYFTDLRWFPPFFLFVCFRFGYFPFSCVQVLWYFPVKPI